MNISQLDNIKKTTLNLVSFPQSIFHKKEVRRVLRNCDVIDPLNIFEYIARDGYFALYKAITEYTPQEVIDIVKESGLRGRGGGGFPTGIKWQFAFDEDMDDKYIICNGDEGDPGAFMDRSVLEKDPHAVIEGMILAGYAIGSKKGFAYVRAEYPLAAKNLQASIESAQQMGLLGENIFESGFGFDIEIRLGAGAFVCGEETALIASIEGNRGMPKVRPPYPAKQGLFEKPTIINNVETLANIPQIIYNGAQWFKKYGTQKSTGTKVFALAGKIKDGGLIEVPMGISLREIIYEVGGGVGNRRKFKAVLTGGPSGGCLTLKHLDEPIDFDNLLSLGSMMGSGGMIVLDDTDCMVDISKFFLDFIVDESCGKCAPCREGTKRMYGILNKITKGEGTLEDLDKLERLAQTIKITSLCGLGKTAPNPVLSTIKNFRQEYIDHIESKRCTAGKCRSLCKYVISDKCIGCTLCAEKCPADCISGDKKELHIIDRKLCIKCGVCLKVCPVDAVEVM